jgi:hypothetical protein
MGIIKKETGITLYLEDSINVHATNNDGRIVIKQGTYSLNLNIHESVEVLEELLALAKERVSELDGANSTNNKVEITKEFLTQKNTAFHCETEGYARWLLQIANDLGFSVDWLTYYDNYTCYSFKCPISPNLDTLPNYVEKGYTIVKVKDLM